MASFPPPPRNSGMSIGKQSPLHDPCVVWKNSEPCLTKLLGRLFYRHMDHASQSFRRESESVRKDPTITHCGRDRAMSWTSLWVTVAEWQMSNSGEIGSPPLFSGDGFPCVKQNPRCRMLWGQQGSAASS